MSRSTAASIRRTIRSLSQHKPSRRYPAELRARIAAHARDELGKGTSLRSLGDALDMAPQTLERFIAEHDDGAASFIPVRVSEPKVPGPRASTVVVRGPRGVVVEGLNVEGVASLIRALS